MQDAKHTPGPWVATQDHSLRDPNAWVVKHKTKVAVSHIAQLHPMSLAPEAGGSTEANARLIAAAPELLEALHSALNIEGAALLGAQSGAWNGLDVQYHFDKIRAAIAKATTE